MYPQLKMVIFQCHVSFQEDIISIQTPIGVILPPPVRDSSPNWIMIWQPSQRKTMKFIIATKESSPFRAELPPAPK